jgi:predicted NUDIX family phosphoesterase
MSDAQIERVLVVPTELFRRLGYFQGFSREVDRYLPGLLDPSQMSFRPRNEVEQDPGFKQLIPYVILRHRNGSERVFQYTRGTGQGEGRLHRKRSVGIGGHISLADLGGRTNVNPYLEGMRRELEEEVIVESTYASQCVGLINDDQTEVGQVHLGLVHMFDLDEARVRPREDDITECCFRPAADILADMDGFETWSQICMRALFG